MTITVELKHAITSDGEEISTLKLKRPNFGDLMQLDSVKGEMAKFAKLIEVCAQIPPSRVKQIDLDDMGAITEAISPFFESFQQIGQSAE
jgi:hypothetical protein